MASPSASQALTKRNADNALMGPPPAPKRIKRPANVIDEDSYTEALSHIIKRDFFPGLLEAEAQQEYLNARESNDRDWIRDAGQKLHQAMTPGPAGRGRRGTSLAQTPRPRTTASATPRGWGGETPMARPRRDMGETPVEGEDEDAPPKPEIDTSLSLAAFTAKYTSEDNESFNKLLDKQNAKRAEKYAFLHQGNNIPSGRLLAWRQHEQKKLLATSSSSDTDTALVPLRPSQDLSTRPATVDGFHPRQGPRNAFMFAPPGIEDTHPTIADTAQTRSTAPPKSVSYASTRMPTSSTDSSLPPPSPSLSAIDAAIAGRPRPSSTDPGACYSGASTPRVAGYAFVDAEPTPAELGVGIPVSDAEAADAERRAYDALLPKALEGGGGGGDGANPFRLQAQSGREALHHRLVDKSSVQRRSGQVSGGSRLEALREGKGAAGWTGRTPTPRFASSPVVLGGGGAAGRKGGHLTPAGRMLAASLGKTPGREGGRGGEGGSLFGREKGRGERSRVWTPRVTPKVVRRE